MKFPLIFLGHGDFAVTQKLFAVSHSETGDDVLIPIFTDPEIALQYLDGFQVQDKDVRSYVIESPDKAVKAFQLIKASHKNAKIIIDPIGSESALCYSVFEFLKLIIDKSDQLQTDGKFRVNHKIFEN